MFLHVFRYRLLTLLRQKWSVGWNVVFPLVLATAFFLGFGNMIKDDPDAFSSIPVAYVLNEESETAFGKLLKEYSKTGEDRLFDLKVSNNKDSAMKLLEDGKVDGIYIDGSEPKLIVKENGMNQTILSQFMNEYENYSNTMENVIKSDPAKAEAAGAVLSEDIDCLKEKTFNGSSDASPYLQYFFALIAMACLYGSWISTSLVESMSANQSEQGARYEAAPVPKWISIVSGALAGLVFVFAAVLILMLYIDFVLKIRLGNQALPMCFGALAGSLIGVTSGLMIGVLCGKNEALKVAVPLTFSMVCSFFGGLMYSGMKQIIEVNAPFLNRINPAALISDCFYALNSYGIGERYYRDCLYMFIMSAVFLTVSAILLRRRNYASI